MSALQTLTYAATLKGYLLATKAPKHMVDLAQAIVDGEIARAGERLSNEEVKLPEIPQSAYLEVNLKPGEELVKHFTVPPCSTPSIAKQSRKHVGYDAEDKKLAIVLPETAQGEAKEESGEVGSADEENASVRPAPSHSNGEPYFTCPKTGRMFIKLSLDDLPALLEELKDKTFDAVGALYNVSSGTIKAFLQANDIDPTQFNKRSGTEGRHYARGVARKAGKKRYQGKACIACGATEKFTSSGACVRCTGARTSAWRTEKDETAPAAPRVFPADVDLLENLEDEAYEAAEEATEEEPSHHGKDGPPDSSPSYRPQSLREWPPHTDFSPDNLNARD
jgi:hypothetical protein